MTVIYMTENLYMAINDRANESTCTPSDFDCHYTVPSGLDVLCTVIWCM